MDIINGWLTPVRLIVSPNYDDRPGNCEISLLIIHSISLPPNQFGGPYIDQLFTNSLVPEEHACFPALCEINVSSHLLIDRLGCVTQFVDFDRRSWHAGVSSFEGCENCNDYSIGIELEGTDDIPYTEQQYQKLAQVTQTIMVHYPQISQDRIVGHSDVAPARKTDPGPAFDWPRFQSMLKQDDD